jgi:hypothetical protein
MTFVLPAHAQMGTIDRNEGARSPKYAPEQGVLLRIRTPARAPAAPAQGKTHHLARDLVRGAVGPVREHVGVVQISGRKKTPPALNAILSAFRLMGVFTYN